MSAQPTGRPSGQPSDQQPDQQPDQASQAPRWRATRGPFLVSEGGRHADAQAQAGAETPTAYYPGGVHGGYYPGGVHGPQGPHGSPPGEPPSGAFTEHGATGLEPVMHKPPAVIAGGVALVLLGLWVAWVVFPWSGHPPTKGNGPVLPMLGALLSLGSGFHLLINGVSSTEDPKSGDVLKNVAIITMVLGALLGLIMLKEGNPALLLPSVLMTFILFTFGFVILLKPRK
jgi:hypothetical protein